MMTMRAAVKQKKIELMKKALVEADGHAPTAAKRLGISKIWMYVCIKQTPSLQEVFDRLRDRRLVPTRKRTRTVNATRP